MQTPPTYLGTVRFKYDGTLCYVVGIETTKPKHLDWVTSYRCVKTGPIENVELHQHPDVPNTPELCALFPTPDLQGELVAAATRLIRQVVMTDDFKESSQSSLRHATNSLRAVLAKLPAETTNQEG